MWHKTEHNILHAASQLLLYAVTWEKLSTEWHVLITEY
jgi:hypothetical protein